MLEGNAFSSQQVNKAAVESGQAMGFKFNVMADPIADLADSMEELSFMFEDKEMKRIGEREVGKSKRSPYFTAVNGWQKIMPDMPGGEFMERMLRMLRFTDLKNCNSQWLLKQLGEGSEDPSHQFAMLECLEVALTENQDDAEIAQLVRDTKAQLVSEKKAEIQVGLNLANQINSLATTPEQMADLRQLYREEILGFKSPQDCFRSLLSRRGPGHLADSIDFLIKGCGIDLQSPSPSQSIDELRRILTDLQCVDVLRTILDSNEEIIRRMKGQFGETCLMTGEKMTGKLMEFTEMAFITQENIASYITSCGFQQLLAKLYFCTDLVNLLHILSPRLFANDADRFKLIDAGQECLDELVRQEEDAEENKKKEMAKKKKS